MTSPASKTLLSLEGSSWFDVALPTSAAPVIWTIVVRASAEINVHKIALEFKNRGFDVDTSFRPEAVDQRRSLLRQT